MKKLLLVAPVLLLGLVSAHPPGGHGPGPGPMAGEGTGYPPCSRTLTDRCIQLHERGVRDPDNLAVNAGDLPPEAGPPPMAQPAQVSGGDYPPCTAARQDRCTQGVSGRRSAPVRYAMAERERVRIGERG